MTLEEYEEIIENIMNEIHDFIIDNPAEEALGIESRIEANIERPFKMAYDFRGHGISEVSVCSLSWDADEEKPFIAYIPLNGKGDEEDVEESYVEGFFNILALHDCIQEMA